MILKVKVLSVWFFPENSNAGNFHQQKHYCFMIMMTVLKTKQNWRKKPQLLMYQIEVFLLF